jgi:hypothetical protein
MRRSSSLVYRRLSTAAKAIPSTAQPTIKLSMWERFRNRITGKTRKDTEKLDIDHLNKFQSIVKSLNTVIFIDAKGVRHPLYNISQTITTMIDVDMLKYMNVDERDSNILDKVGNALNDSVIQSEGELMNYLLAETSDSLDIKMQYLLRISLLKQYIIQLRKKLKENELESISLVTFRQLVDAFLLGSASERIMLHLSLYGDKCTQHSLQHSFYNLYDPEIDVTTSIFVKLNKNYEKIHNKKFKKFSATYLLDKLELNSKSRMTFCWSLSTFSGFQPLDDDYVMPMQEVIKTRCEYFKEGNEVSSELMKAYVADRKEYYNEKADNRETINNGIIFFIVTVLADMYLERL